MKIDMFLSGDSVSLISDWVWDPSNGTAEESSRCDKSLMLKWIMNKTKQK